MSFYLLLGVVTVGVVACGGLALRERRKGQAMVACNLVMNALLLVACLAWLIFKLCSVDRDFVIAPDPEHCALRISGHLPLLYADRIDQALRAAPETRAVVLDSPGGYDLDLLDTLRVFRARRIQIGVVQYGCASACAVMWAAFPDRRTLSAPEIGSIGFHGSYGTFFSATYSLNHRDRDVDRFLLSVAQLPAAFVSWASVYRGAQTERISANDLNRRFGLGVYSYGYGPHPAPNYCGRSPR